MMMLSGWDGTEEVEAKNPMDKDTKRPAIVNENWDERKLVRILREAHRRFYMSPWYIAERIKEVTSLKDFIRKAMAGFKLFHVVSEKHDKQEAGCLDVLKIRRLSLSKNS